jgi:hypothetical protein
MESSGQTMQAEKLLSSLMKMIVLGGCQTTEPRPGILVWWSLVANEQKKNLQKIKTYKTAQDLNSVCK